MESSIKLNSSHCFVQNYETCFLLSCAEITYICFSINKINKILSLNWTFPSKMAYVVSW